MTTHGYSSNDMIIASCPSAEQVSVLLSSASIFAAEDVITLCTDSSTKRNIIQSSSSSQKEEKVLRKTSIERKVSFDQDPIVPDTCSSTNTTTSHSTSTTKMLPEHNDNELSSSSCVLDENVAK